VWPERKAKRREALKQELHEACGSAKELGDLVARKKQSIAVLKSQLAAMAPDCDEAEQLRLRKQMDTAYFKDTVQQLKEYKAKIEALQQQLSESQDELQSDFLSWHRTALAEAHKKQDRHRAVELTSAGGERVTSNWKERVRP